MDMGYVGVSSPGGTVVSGRASIQGRLDRFCGDVEWVSRFPSYQVTHLDEKVPDHLSITLDTRPAELGQRTAKRRRFEMMLINDDRWDKVVEGSSANCASSNAIVISITKFKRCLSLLQQWNWPEFGHV